MLEAFVSDVGKSGLRSLSSCFRSKVWTQEEHQLQLVKGRVCLLVLTRLSMTSCPWRPFSTTSAKQLSLEDILHWTPVRLKLQKKSVWCNIKGQGLILLLKISSRRFQTWVAFGYTSPVLHGMKSHSCLTAEKKPWVRLAETGPYSRAFDLIPAGLLTLAN